MIWPCTGEDIAKITDRNSNSADHDRTAWMCRLNIVSSSSKGKYNCFLQAEGKAVYRGYILKIVALHIFL